MDKIVKQFSPGPIDNMGCYFRRFGGHLYPQRRHWSIVSVNCPAGMSRRPNAGSMLGRRRRRWTNIEPALGRRLMLAGWPHDTRDINTEMTSVVDNYNNSFLILTNDALEPTWPVLSRSINTVWLKCGGCLSVYIKYAHGNGFWSWITWKCWANKLL